ncbi:hypothetical protein GCM10023171_15140 [Microbacterium panaciterrae]|uniref:Uncharacterized protein n=1 Tax=Microbacterium panaciterrae TaxID=985759 RepID=A0ABP8P7Y9_9MICO
MEQGEKHVREPEPHSSAPPIMVNAALAAGVRMLTSGRADPHVRPRGLFVVGTPRPVHLVTLIPHVVLVVHPDTVVTKCCRARDLAPMSRRGENVRVRPGDGIDAFAYQDDRAVHESILDGGSADPSSLQFVPARHSAALDQESFDR